MEKENMSSYIVEIEKKKIEELNILLNILKRNYESTETLVDNLISLSLTLEDGDHGETVKKDLVEIKQQLNDMVSQIKESKSK